MPEKLSSGSKGRQRNNEDGTNEQRNVQKQIDEDELPMQSESSDSEADEQKDSESSAESQELPDMLGDGLPKEVKGIQREIFQSVMMMASGAGNPLSKHIKSEHISNLIEVWNSENENSHDIKKRNIDKAKSDRNYSLIYYFSGLAFAVFIIVFLTDNNPSLIETILKYSLGAIAGLGGGGFLVLRKYTKKE